MKSPSFLLFVILCILLSSCIPATPQSISLPTSIPPTSVPSPTSLPITSTHSPTSIPITSTLSPSPSPTEPRPTATRTPTGTPIPSDTPIPPTPTPPPQPLLLRRPCGRDYVVRADKPLQIFYGGWGVRGKELADQWATALVIDLTIDGETIAGKQQPLADDLPYNCRSDRFEDLYWLYSMVVIPGLPAGEHHVSMVFNSLRALPDGSGVTYGTGRLLENTFRVISQ